MSTFTVNSKEYWDNRFGSGDWQAHGGEQQAVYFCSLALQEFPEWLNKELYRNSWEIADWGCAEGAGTALLARTFPGCHVMGVDFSREAVEQAKRTYPSCDFVVGDITKDVQPTDVIFCSNTLEHLKNPRDVLVDLVNKAAKCAVIMLPFHDNFGFDEHLYKFTEDFFPLHINNMRLSFFKIIDCKHFNAAYWPGEQILLVYANETDYGEGYLSDLFSNSEYEKLCALLEKTTSDLESEQEEMRIRLEAEREGMRVKLEAEREEMRVKLEAEEVRHTQDIAALESRINEAQEELLRLKSAHDELSEQLTQTELAREELENRSKESEYRISTTLNQVHAMMGSRLFRLVHFLNRLFHQGFNRNREERKKFRQWIFSRIKHAPDSDHRYNPLYSVVELLGGTDGGRNDIEDIPGHELQEEKLDLEKHLRAQNTFIERVLSEPLSEEAQKLRLAIDTYSYKGILVYPQVVCWEPIQTPQQLLRAFAKAGWLCFFCESPIVQYACREEMPNLFITYESDLIQAIGTTPVNILLTSMSSLAFVDHVPNKKVWYHILDHLEIFGYYNELYVQLHNEVLRKASVTSYVAKPLRELTEGITEAVYLPNGVVVTEFLDAKKQAIPEDMLPIVQTGHKIVGYYGYIGEWMDYDMVREVALQRPEWEFVFIGPAFIDVSKISELPNVHLLGMKFYKDIPAYGQLFDVATIPFQVDEKMDCVSPIKFYEYLALGKPVVSSKMVELEPFAEKWGFIFCADGSEEFLACIDQAMEPLNTQMAAKCGPEIAKENSWGNRVRAMEAYLKSKD